MELTRTTSACEIAAAVQTKQVSAREVADFYLEQVQNLDSKVNAFTWIDPKKIRGAAESTDQRINIGRELRRSFLGVPMPIKELTDVAGDPATMASKAFGDRIAQQDSTVVSRLRAAGATLFGRTNSPEIGTLPVTENELYGVTCNPWNPNYSAGGSSGGAAAAVALGMAPIAHGSDGGGSIRIPASCCNLVGLKVSRGRIPRGPLISDVFHGMAVDGCISRHVIDTARFLDTTSFFDPTGWYSLPPPKASFENQTQLVMPPATFAVDSQGPLGQPCHEEYEPLLEKVAKLLEGAGHIRRSQGIHWGPYSKESLAEDFFRLWYTGSAYSGGQGDISKLEPLNAALRAKGLATSSISYIESLMRLQVFSRVINEQFHEKISLLVTPTISGPPPLNGWLFDDLGQPLDADKALWRATAMVPYTGFANITGLPAISIPAGFSKNGLPMGIQIVGPPRGEGLLLNIAMGLEQELGWVDQLPS